MADPKISFIGPGVMAEAMIAGLNRTNLADGKNIMAAGPRIERGKKLKSVYGLSVTSNNQEAAKLADILVLSVKPQQLAKVMREIRGLLRADCLVLSIVAGASIAKIAKGLGHEKIVRAMPNTPARIGEGISVWTAASAVSSEERELGESLLAALGKTLHMEDESFLDKATALSGTGPAYVYLFMEAMVDAGVHLGFPRRIAEELVVETVRGSVDFYDQSEEERRHLARLRNQVTSPGGTSAEAIYYLEKAGFRTAISRAIWAAYERSQGLGDEENGGKN